MVIGPYALHWFRRDLRSRDHRALADGVAQFSGRVLGVFTVDRAILGRPDISHDRFQFLLETLLVLQNDQRERGGDLIVLDGGPEVAFKRLFEGLKKHGKPLPAKLTYCRDYEPFALVRDEHIDGLMTSYAVPVETYRDHLLIEPLELFKPDDKAAGYQVYTPFQKRWLTLLHEPRIAERLGLVKTVSFSLKWDSLIKGAQAADQLAAVIAENRPRVSVPMPKAGEKAAKAALTSFLDRIKQYEIQRDVPSVKGTSGFSIYFKNGSLTVPQVIRSAGLADRTQRDPGRRKFLQELIWREFYYHVLFRNPRVETEEFQARFKNLPWENREDHFAAWQEGRTGYPIVDAGMRQLKATGWMHNRVRMIVASFLTKDLLIDWRWGERHFMKHLLDGDLAPNNGGWQWAASTGCDAQPYFRIFNPALQSKRWDPDGSYIRKYVPELAKAKNVHEPDPKDRGTEYPAPIVDHGVQRMRAEKLYSPRVGKTGATSNRTNGIKVKMTTMKAPDGKSQT